MGATCDKIYSFILSNTLIIASNSFIFDWAFFRASSKLTIAPPPAPGIGAPTGVDKGKAFKPALPTVIIIFKVGINSLAISINSVNLSNLSVTEEISC